MTARVMGVAVFLDGPDGIDVAVQGGRTVLLLDADTTVHVSIRAADPAAVWQAIAAAALEAAQFADQQTAAERTAAA